MGAKLSNTQIDRLGDRLKVGHHTEADLGLLAEYRESFAEAHDSVVKTIHNQLRTSPSGRKKITDSIVAKLRRERIRLTQIQDIAGCRVVVADVVEQERFVASLMEVFPDALVVDRREAPSHGYRAVHVIPKVVGKAVEIQLRTPLQHDWAELSEKASDILDPMIKYGGGPDEWRSVSTSYSDLIRRVEAIEREPGAESQRERLLRLKAAIADPIRGLTTWLDDMKGLKS